MTTPIHYFQLSVLVIAAIIARSSLKIYGEKKSLVFATIVEIWLVQVGARL
jgi:hypothetical protein